MNPPISYVHHGPLADAYPPTLSPEQLSNLIFNIRDYQLTHGMLLKYGPNASSIHAIPIGVSLFPTLFPDTLFAEAWEVQPVYNMLYARVAEDEEWLQEVLEGLIRDDEFAKTLWRIYEEVKREGYVQDVTLGLFRSDYMIHKSEHANSSRPTLELKQIEFNTYSVAGGAHSTNAAHMHKHLHRIGLHSLPQALDIEEATAHQHAPVVPFPTTASAPLNLSSDVGRPVPPPVAAVPSTTPANPPGNQHPPHDSLTQVSHPRFPHNDTITSLVSGLIAAHEIYGSPQSPLASRTGILFIVQPRNVNICDERPLEYALWKHQPPIPAYRAIFGGEVLARTTLTKTRELLYQPPSPSGTPPVEISVVYLRAGSDPEEYSTAAGYEARLRLERSRAVKCPTILAHLATSKKVQQALSVPGALARFLNPGEVEQIEKTFAAMYPLDGHSEAGRRGRALACNPQTAAHHVLKPSREGGGHNVYRGSIPDFLKARPETGWHTYVLMELINPVVQRNILLSPQGLYTAIEAESTESAASSGKQRRPPLGQPLSQPPAPTVSELGIFGVCLWASSGKTGTNGDPRPSPKILANTQAGWSLKTKPETVDEMSVVKGYGCFDCPYLVDEQTYLTNRMDST